MKLHRNTVLGILYAALVLASTNASALTLGKLRGAVLLGKELDLAVTVQYAADEDIANTCFDADVRIGDIPVESSRLTVKAVAGPLPHTQVVHITSMSRVEDAVVTVNLRTSCGPKASRRYVLLSDVLTDSSSPAVASAGAGNTASAKLELSPVATKATPVAPTASPAKEAGPALAKSNKVAAAAVAKKSPAIFGSSDHAAAAKAASQANALVLEDLQRRVDGIEKWQSQTTVADDLLKSQERNQILDTGLTGLKTVTAKNQQNLQQVSAALEGVESENYGQSLVYALVALFVACAGTVAYVIKRSPRVAGSDATPWWSGGEPRSDLKATPGSAAVEAQRSAAGAVPQEAVPQKSPARHREEVVAQVAPPVISAPVVDVDFDIDLAAEHASDAGLASVSVPAQPIAQTPVKVDALTDGAVQNRVINTKEMLDVRQQAEFFMALGQHDDAVGLLESSIRNNSEANPLVYLDLLKIFHTLSRREDFERYRAEFNQCFTGRVPPYADFLNEGNGLDAYEEICQQIVVLWPTEYTVDFIEQCLVRTPEDDPEQGIDLEAFKDLLMLHGVLKRLSQPAADSSMIPFSASRVANSVLGVPPRDSDSAPQVPVAPDVVPLPTISGSAEEAAVDLDLDLGGDVPSAIAPDPGNLIDFDMSGFVKPESDKSGAK